LESSSYVPLVAQAQGYLYLLVLAYSSVVLGWVHKDETPPSEIRYFPEHKNGNQKTLNGCLIGQPTASQGDTFHFNKSFYVDDSVFLHDNEEDVEKAAKIILKQFRKFGLTMHVGDKTDPKLRQCTSLPPSKKLVNQEKKTKKTNNINLPNGKNLHFTWHLKYLGSFISPELNEDAEITYRIKS